MGVLRRGWRGRSFVARNWGTGARRVVEDLFGLDEDETLAIVK